MKITERIKRIPKKTAVVTVCILGLLLAVIGVAVALSFHQEEGVTYKETEVLYGDLTVGITEEGTVSVGTSTQKLTLDISAFSSQQSNGFTWSMAMPGMGQNGGSQSSSGTDSRELEVEQVYITVGQQIAKGDPIYKLSEKSVKSIREELVSDKEDAKLALEQMETSQKQENLTAAHEYETNTTYGAAAELEYNETVSELLLAYEQAEEKLVTSQEELAELQEEKSALEVRLEEEQKLYDEAAYRVTYIDMEDDPYGYASTLELSTSALETKENTEDAIEDKEEEITAKQKEIATLTIELSQAEKEKRTGEIKAQNTMQNRILSYQNAAELYTVLKALSEENRAEAEDAYEEAREKLEDFDACIQEDNLLSEYDGVVTGVLAEKGTVLSKGSELIAVNDYAQAEVTVSVEDSNIDNIHVGDTVNISLSAFPDTDYTGVVTEIGDAQVNSYSSKITYDVTVEIDGDVSGIYEGMSSEVTFITKETKQVVYVSNRAINRDGTQSYVYVRDEEGSVIRQNVNTGFSDGINVEITEGLSEGDMVLIESKVDNG